MKKVLLTGLLGLVCSTGAMAQSSTGNSYLGSSSGVVTSGTGLCWLTLGDKHAEEKCGDVIKKAVKAPAVQQPSQPAQVAVPVIVEKAPVNVNVDLKILFGFDSSKLTHSSMETLRKWTLKYDIRNVRIVGHSDQIGKNNYNDTLSAKRATVVKNYLLTLGVPETAFVSIVGAGKTAPDVECKPKTVECEAPNRRVEVEADALIR